MILLNKYYLLINFLFSFFTICYAQTDNIESKCHQIVVDGENVTYINPTISSISKNNTIASDGHTLVINADFQMKMILIFNNYKDEFYNFAPNNEYSFDNLRDGTYHMISLYYDLDINNRYFMTLFYEEFEITSDDTLNIKYEDADKEKIFNLKQIDNSPLLMSEITFSFYNKLVDNGIMYSRLNLNYLIDELHDEFILKYNKFPNAPFQNEWFVKGKQLLNEGDFYILNGEFTNSNTDTIIENNPDNFGHANFSYNFPDSTVAPWINVGFFLSIHSFLDDPQYSLPIKISVYQDTSANIELEYSRFSNTVTLQQPYDLVDLISIKMRLGKNRVYGYTSQESFNNPIILSNTEDLTLGLTPTYWFGKYNNCLDTILIESEWGVLNATQLFLSQTNDLLPQYPHKIEISSRDSLLLKKTIISKYMEGMFSWAGYEIDSLTFPVKPDWYKVTVTNDKSEVAKKVASTTAIAEFDLNRLDKNPPYMRQFQILANEKLTHVLSSDKNNTIDFIVEDDNELRKVQLFYRTENDTSWIKLPLSDNNNIYQGALPDLSSGFYQLKIFASDISQNTLSVLMEPAFLYQKTTEIRSIDYPNTEYILFNNYPNPFNPTTIISYNLPDISFVNIKVYDFLGREVLVLVSEEQKPGIHKINLDGSKLSSGIYFVTFKSNKYYKTIKTILLR